MMTLATIKRLKEDSIVVYVGGYDGRVATNYLNCRPFALHIIEPCPKNYKIMKKNLESYPDVKCHQMAIGGETGGGMLNVCHFSGKAGSSGSNSLFKDHLKKFKKIPVQTCTMDDFVKINGIDHIDLLKLNCEGGEYFIFPGDWMDITDMISVSFHAKNKFFNSDRFVEKRKEIYQHLESKGFILDIGKKWLTSDTHINQLWRKPKGGK